MERRLIKIDSNGFMAGEEIYSTQETPDGFTDITLPTDENGCQLPFYRPRLVEGAWVEDMTQEEINEFNKPTEPIPTEIDLLREELSLAVLELASIIGGVE